MRFSFLLFFIFLFFTINAQINDSLISAYNLINFTRLILLFIINVMLKMLFKNYRQQQAKQSQGNFKNMLLQKNMF